ncbi:MAG: hypothetical protein IJO73_02345 [Clostridia bacterium]|nr:hypothetical protein [Clostridia bacterium]
MAINFDTYRKRAKQLDDEEKKKREKEAQKRKTGGTTVTGPSASTVKRTVTGPVKKQDKNENERTWFKKGAFSDGYQFGDVTKTLLGTAADVGENIGTGIIGMGERAVDALTMLGTTMGNSQMSQLSNDELAFKALTGKSKQADKTVKKYDTLQKDAKKGATEFVKKDLYDEEKISKKILTAPFEKRTGINTEAASILGERSDSLVQSAGQLLATAGLSAVGVPWFLTTGATSFGAEAENAMNEGASFEQASMSAAVSAGAEILSEKLFGGIKFGGKTLDDVILKPFVEKISNKAVKALVNLGVDTVGEGAEEVFSSVFSRLGSALYKEESIGELLTSEEAFDEYLESFIGGAFLGNVSSGVKTIANINKSELTANEQKVVDKVVEDRIAEREKDGKKLTSKDKNKIFDEVVKDLTEGAIDTDTIESVLGGEGYESYKNLKDKADTLRDKVNRSNEQLQEKYDKLQEEHDALDSNNLEQSSRQSSIEEEQAKIKEQFEKNKSILKELDADTSLDTLKTKLGENVSSLVKDSRLNESYNEKARRKEAFSANLDKYDEKQRAVIEKAVESGILNNTRKTHRFVDFIARISADKGVSFDFTSNEKLKESGFAIEGKTVNGLVTKDGVQINVNSAKALNSVVGHEVTHIFEDTALYPEIQRLVKEAAVKKGEYQSRYDEIAKLYEGVEGANIEQELTADLVGDYLFTDRDFISRLSAEKPGVFKKIFDEIKYLCRVATAGSKEQKELEKVKKTFEELYRESKATVPGETKYSMAGIKSKTHNFTALEQAARLEDVGKATSEEIRQQTGWFRGYDGEWRYEIADSKMKIRDVDITSGETKLSEVIEHPELFEAYPQLKDITVSAFPSIFDFGTNGKYNPVRKEISLNSAFLVNTKVEKEIAQIRESAEYISYKNRLEEAAKAHGKKRLELSKEFKGIRESEDYKEYIDSFFECETKEQEKAVTERWESTEDGKRYEEIKTELARMDKENPQTIIENEFRESDTGKRYYELLNNIDTAEVTDNTRTRSILIHEIQHAIQDIEGFAGGSSPEFWKKAPAEKKPGTIVYAKAQRDKIGSQILSTASPEFIEAFRAYNRGDIEYSDIENGPYSEDELELLWDYDEADREVSYLMSHGERSDENFYFSTAGEIEARDASQRLDYTAVQRKNTRPDIDRTDVVFAEGGVSSNFIGHNDDGLEVYETSEEIKKLPYSERKKIFANLMATNFFGKTAKFKRNGHVYYAKFDESSLEKNIYGDKYSSPRGWKAKINVGADGNIFELVENSSYDHSKPEKGKKGAVHKNVGYWDYFVKTVQVDNVVYDVLINIRRKTEQDYVYSIRLWENKKIKASPPVGTSEMSSVNLGAQHFVNNISHSPENVKQKDDFSLSSKDTAPKKHGDYAVYGEDVMLEGEAKPTGKREFAAPTRESIAEGKKKVITGAPMRADVKPLKNEQVAEKETVEPVETTVIKTVEDRITAKIKNSKEELSNNQRLPEESNADFDRRIAEAQAEYDAKKNKNTKVANNILRRIETLKRRKSNISADYSKRINDIEASITRKEGALSHYRDGLTKEQADRLEKYHRRSERRLEADKKALDEEYAEKKASLQEEVKDKNAFISRRAKALYDEKRSMQKGKRVSKELGFLLDLRKEMGVDWEEFNSAIFRVSRHPDTVIDADSEMEAAVRAELNNEFQDRTDELKQLDTKLAEEKQKLEDDADKAFEKFERANRRMTKQKELEEQMAELIGDTSNWKDKKYGLRYKVNTLKRNLRDIVRDDKGKRDIAKADRIYYELQGKYNHNEAELFRESNKIKEKYEKMEITKAEDKYIQMLGELGQNPDTTLTVEDVEEYYEKHKKQINSDKVQEIIKMARKDYDDLLVRVNRVLKEHGMQEILHRKGYFPHFTEEKQGILGKLFNWKTQNNDVPTDIAGMTESFNPTRSWQSFNKHRTGDDTVYSFMKGFDTYVHGALDWIYHIEDLQKRRAFENHIRYIHSEEGIKEQIEAIKNNEEYDADTAQSQIEMVYANAKNPLNNFVTNFRTATNTLAGKKSSMDRGMEEDTNRRAYSTMTNISNRVSGNLIAGSISSAFTNFIPITQSWGQVSPISTLKAMKQTMASTFRDDGTINKSDFLTTRLRAPENLYKTAWDKIGSKVGWLMESIDSFTSQTVWRSKYMENIANGMSENEAIKNADQFSANVMASRSRGDLPTIFDSKNPFTKVLTAFQVEVSNNYGYMLKDMPQDMAEKSKAKLVKGYLEMFVGAYAYNALYSKIVGRDAAFDPIGIIEDVLKDLGVIGDDWMPVEILEALGLLDEDDEKEETDVADVFDAIGGFAKNVAEEIPYVGGLLGGGRIPISSALPYDGHISELWDSTQGVVSELNFDDGMPGFWASAKEAVKSKHFKSLTRELLNPVYYLAMPMGGGQLRKTIQGLKMFDKDLPIAGSYTDSGNLRFPVEKTPWNVAQAALFGQYANKNAQTYFDEGYAPLKEKQIQEFKDVGLPIADYWKIREGLSALEPEEGKTQVTLNQKGDYIGSLDLPTKTKNVLINSIADRETPINMSTYSKYEDFEEFDFATKNPDIYKVLQQEGVSVKEYKEKYEKSVFMRTDDFAWAAQNPESYALSKAVTDNVTEFRQYTGKLYEIRADKDSNGKAISGSAKRKKKAYIWSLDIDEGSKYILFRKEYPSDDTYNGTIIDYVLGRNDLSYEDKKTILLELDFNIDDKGRISWN